MADWSGTGKFFILLGGGFLLIGIVLVMLGRWPGLGSGLSWFGKLPGDILIKRENFTFYFPLATSLVISVVLSLLIFLFSRR
jgi:hypothetical protein